MARRAHRSRRGHARQAPRTRGPPRLHGPAEARRALPRRPRRRRCCERAGGRGVLTGRRGASRGGREGGDDPGRRPGTGHTRADRVDRDARRRARAAVGVVDFDRQHRGRGATSTRRPGGRTARALHRRTPRRSGSGEARSTSDSAATPRARPGRTRATPSCWPTSRTPTGRSRSHSTPTARCTGRSPSSSHGKSLRRRRWRVPRQRDAP